MDYGAISWLAVVVAAAVFFVIGGLWYAVVFKNVYGRAAGMTGDERADPIPFIVTFVLLVVAAIGLAALLGEDAEVGLGLQRGLEVGGFFVLTSLAITALFDRKPPVLFALNAGYNLLGFLAMGAVIGAMQ